MNWREYHEATKHSTESLRRNRHSLDWQNMPDPFRHYEGAPVLDLPADPPAPGAATPDGAAFLSQLLFYSAAISASKRVPSTGYTYALRVNPSSGNLHPTEFHFITRGLKDWPDGLYHYRPSSHMAEQRAAGRFEGTATVEFLLTSIAWREAWKYRDRAYRYCLHDIGHAWQSLAMAAEAMGCTTFATGQLDDDALAALFRLHPDEWPMLGVRLSGDTIPIGGAGAAVTEWHEGQANPLSVHVIPYASIEGVHAATKRLGNAPAGTPSRNPALPRYGELARKRRSALDFDPTAGSLPLPQLAAILTAAMQPLSADFAAAPFIQLCLYAHEVEGLPRGVYRYRPRQGELEPVRSGDQRVVAAGLSLGQALAGNACVAFSMIADLDDATRAFGDRGYRYAFFEAGAIGQRLYLAAESHGLGATGIGAFFDDEVHRHLNIAPAQGQVVYHFAIGHPVPDPRVMA